MEGIVDAHHHIWRLEDLEWLKRLDRKQIEFAFEERDYGTFLIKRYTTWENDTSVNVQCNEDFDPIRNLMIHFIRSNELIGAINEYYDND